MNRRAQPNLFTPHFLDDCSDLEKRCFYNNKTPVAGTDEAGRGPLAGPVVAAAVIWNYWEDPHLLQDSKSISNNKRLQVYHSILDKALGVSIGLCESEVIDNVNIHNASLLAMRKALITLDRIPSAVIIDGKFSIPSLSTEQFPVIQGDKKIIAVSAASIVAKVVRDSIMKSYNNIYSGYSFHKHKGYPTQKHVDCLKNKGPSPIHRFSYKPVRESTDED